MGVGLWLLGGAVTMPLLLLVWQSSPSDDVDYDPMALLFSGALVAWVGLGIALLVGWLLHRAAMVEASLRAEVENNTAL